MPPKPALFSVSKRVRVGIVGISMSGHNIHCLDWAGRVPWCQKGLILSRVGK